MVCLRLNVLKIQKVFLAIHNSDTAPDEEVQKQVADGGVVSQLQLYEVCLFQCDTRLYLNYESRRHIFTENISY